MPRAMAKEQDWRAPLGLVGAVLCSAWALGCGGAAGRDAGAEVTTADLGADVYPRTEEGAAALPLLGETALEATWQELAVPGASSRPALASTPSGLLALSRRARGDAKAPSAWQSYLYRSTDGIRWQRVEVSERNDNLWLRGVAYGAGHYVLAGKRFGGGDDVIFHSTDGEHWDELAVSTGAPSGFSGAVFAGGRFFAFSTFRTLLTSTDGTTWTLVDLASTLQPSDVAFGDGRYLVVGSGAPQFSTDGVRWAPAPLDCAMPGACIMDPDGNVLQGFHSTAVFAGGSYLIDQASSTDGQTWQPLPGLYPEARVGDHVVGSSATERLVIWQPGESARPLAHVRYVETLSDEERPARLLWNGAVERDELSNDNFPIDAPPPDHLEFPISGSANCTTAACVIVGERLYLVPGAR